MQVDKYEIEIAFVNRVHGGIPVVGEDATTEERAERYDGWLGKQIGLSGYSPEESAESATALAEALSIDVGMPTVEQPYENQLNGFRRSPDGRPCLERRQVKAMLREAAQRLGFIEKTRGTRQVLQHDLVVRPIDGNGDLLDLGVDAVDGIEDRPVHVSTPQGPRSAIASNEYVEDAVLKRPLPLLLAKRLFVVGG